jgi:predicted transposase/invertase (TIGR01784 family)
MSQYEKSVLEYADVKRAMDYRFEKGVEKGVEKGIKKGVEKGKFEIAQRLLDMHFPVVDIAKATGLTPDQILSIP